MTNIRDHYSRLPEKIQKAIFSDDLQKKVLLIGQKHGLQIDQIGQLLDSVKLTLVGKNDYKDFTKLLTDTWDMQSSTATEITKDINAEIFIPPRESMKETTAEPVKEVVEVDEGHEEIIDEHAEREAVLAEISNPTPTISSFAKKASGSDVVSNVPLNVVTEQEEVTPPVPDLHETQLEGQSSSVQIIKDSAVKTDSTTQEVKNRIADDPYKESI